MVCEAPALIVKVVPLVTPVTVAPVGMPGPETSMPVTSPAVLATVMVVLAAVVERPVSVTRPCGSNRTGALMVGVP